ncbi:MAG: BA14K family protein [Bradyrhizobium sp.]
MNRLSRNLTAALLIAATLGLAVPAHAVPIASPLMPKEAAAPAAQTVQYRRGWHGHGYGGAAVGLGIAGALIGGAIIGATRPYGQYGYGPGYYYGPAYVAPPPYVGDDTVYYCAQRFRSYDPYSGTYLGYDGLRHPCP